MKPATQDILYQSEEILKVLKQQSASAKIVYFGLIFLKWFSLAYLAFVIALIVYYA